MQGGPRPGGGPAVLRTVSLVRDRTGSESFCRTLTRLTYAVPSTAVSHRLAMLPSIRVASRRASVLRTSVVRGTSVAVVPRVTLPPLPIRRPGTPTVQADHALPRGRAARAP